MAGRLEKLLMRVELIDKVTGTANRIGNSLDRLQKQTEVGFTEVLKGVAGLWGAGTALDGLTSDYRDFHHALAEVSTLSVATDAMTHLEKAALRFSIRYGESAADFVRSSYDIQSAIAGLAGNELAAFTEASNILAKGSKADAATITNYMGTMYGIFKNSADAMGKARWVEQLTGQTSLAVEIFKSDGAQMSAAFTSLGADAQAHGIAINEQMAVLGQLQATMSGSEAGTKYKAFLRGVGAAQKELGLRFTDSAGRMLPVDQILGKLQGKFGAIDTVAESDLLKKAFGSDEAVAAIKLLINDADGLTNAIGAIGAVDGMDKARWMAEQLADPLARLQQASVAVKIGFGALVQKALTPFYNATIENLSTLSQWIDKYPHLFGALAKLAILIIAVTAGIALFAAVKGLAIIAGQGLAVGMIALRLVMLPFRPLLTALRFAWLVFNMQMLAGAGVIPALRAAMIAFNKQLLINLRSLRLVRFATWLWTATLGFARAVVLATAIRFPLLLTGLLTMRSGFMTAAVGARAFALALLTNPITWIVLGVTALIAGLVLMVTHWDSVKVAVGNAVTWMLEKWQAFRAIMEDNPVLKFIFQPLLLAADFVGFLITNLEKIPAWFTTFKQWLTDLNLFDVLLAPAKLALEMLNKIPGVDIDTSQIGSAKVEQAASAVPNEAVAPVPRAAETSVPVTHQPPGQAPQLTPQLEQATNPLNIPARVQISEPVTVPVVAVAPANPVTPNVPVPNPAPIPEPVAVPPVVAAAPQSPVPPAIVRAESQSQQVEGVREELKPPPAAPVKNVPQAGLQQQFNSTTRNRTTHIGSLNVNTTQAVNGYSLQDQLRMAGG